MLSFLQPMDDFRIRTRSGGILTGKYNRKVTNTFEYSVLWPEILKYLRMAHYRKSGKS